MIPHNPEDPQQLERKRFLGNDIVVIVFLDSDVTSPYKAETITSQFNHVSRSFSFPISEYLTSYKNQILLVVQPAKKLEQEVTHYKVEVARKKGVPSFEPTLPNNRYLLPKSNVLRHFLLTKLVNGERACFEAPQFAPKIKKSRREILASLLK